MDVLMAMPFPRGRFISWPVVRAGLALALAGATLAACGDDTETYIARDVETLYNLGRDTVDKGQYRQAAAVFEEVERQHPYSVWARRAQLMAAYSYYQSNRYQESILAAQRFLALHPGNRDAPYAYYLIAICYYEQISDIARDQKMTEQALQSLTEVIRRFPNSEYARDARLKLDLTRDHLAGKEMDIGRWYQRRGEYLAASLRFRNVVDTYETTSHVAEALHRLTETYLELGIREEAQRSAATLGYNYPGSKWYRRSYDLLREARITLADLPAPRARTQEPIRPAQPRGGATPPPPTIN
jgi:outer membrane protein assembly factor BamD